jgi:hypothetical protein
MINWIVGEETDGGTAIARLPPDNGYRSLEKLGQPMELRRNKITQEVEMEVGADIKRFGRFGPSRQKGAPQNDRRIVETERWEISDKDGKVHFTGTNSVSDNLSSWFVIKEVKDKKKGLAYHITRANEWINFSAKTLAMDSAPDLEESEKVMKESQLRAKAEFNDYLKQKRRKAEENGIIPQDFLGEGATTGQKSSIEKARRKLLFKRVRGAEDGDDMDVPESSVAYVGNSREIDGEWEGAEAFSDDDEQLFEDEANANLGLEIDVEDDDVEKDNDVRDDEDLDAQAEDLFRNAFGLEIQKLIHNEQEKEHVAEDELDDELSKYASLSPDQEEEEEAEISTESRSAPAPSTALRKAGSKEEQIRARVKGMFWRNDNQLKLKEVLTQFPGLSKASEEYQFLTKALRDLADVQGDRLILKQQFRK